LRDWARASLAASSVLRSSVILKTLNCENQGRYPALADYTQTRRGDDPLPILRIRRKITLSSPDGDVPSVNLVPKFVQGLRDADVISK